MAIASVAGGAGSRFVGRTDELEALGAALEAAAGGHGGVVLVTGEPGIGKTRLLEEAVASLPRRRVVWGRCRESGGAPAYWPWMQALRAYAGSLAPADLTALLAADAPLLARLVPQPGVPTPFRPAEPAGDPEEARFHLFDALAAFLGRATADEALVVVLDDLHWADSESLLLLRFLAAEARGLRLLVLGAHRDFDARQTGAAARLLADVARLGQRLVLRGLEHDEITTLVHGALGDASQDLVAAIERSSEGNPFFVRELAVLVARHGAFGDGLPLPEELRELVLRRLEPLSPEARRLLGAASVVGREFELPLVAAVAGVEPADALSHLDEAVAAGAVAEVEGALERYRFVHALVHGTIYDDLPPTERAALHGRASAALEAAHAAAPDGVAAELAHHLFRSEDGAAVQRAIGWAVRAGELARAELGYEEAAGHFERALEAMSGTGRPLAERLPVLLRFGEAQICADDVDGFRATFLEAARIARELRDAPRLAEAALGFATLRHFTGLDPAKVGLLEEAADALGDEHAVLRARVLARLASASYYAYPPEQRERLSAQAVDLARALGDRDTLARVLLERYHALLGPDRPRERLEASLETARLAGDESPAIACEARLHAIGDLLILGDAAAATRELEAADALATRLRLGRHQWRATVVRAMLALLEGDVAGSEALAERAAKLARGTSAADSANVYASQVFQVRRVQGRLAELAGLVDGMVERNPGLRVWRFAAAMIHAELGSVERARALVDELTARDLKDLPRDWGWLPSLAGLAEVCARIGDARRAALLEELLLPYAETIVLQTPGVCLGPMERYLGLLALARGDAQAAVERLERATGRCASLAWPIELVQAQEGLARALVARASPGDHERARALVRDALESVERLRLSGLAPRLRSVPLDAPAAGARTPASRVRSEAAVARLRRVPEGWAVEHDGESGVVKHTKGMSYLVALLRVPREGVTAVALAGRASERASGREGRPGAAAGALARQEAEALRAELEEAEAWGDLGRAQLLRERLEDLAERLVGGLAPSAEGPSREAERARLNVTRALQGALRNVAAVCPRLGEHLAAAVKTGVVCCYDPDPATAPSWDIEQEEERA